MWLSATGSHYHKINNCGRMNPAKARQVTIGEAQAKGLLDYFLSRPDDWMFYTNEIVKNCKDGSAGV